MEHYKNLSLEDIVYVDDNGVTCVEQWKDIPEYEGLYRASDLGRIKSLEKPRKKSENNPNSFIRERILKGAGKKYLGCVLYKEGAKKIFPIHHLISITFFGFYPYVGNIVVDHKNNIQKDNRLINLQLISRRHNLIKDSKNTSGCTGVYYRNNKYEVKIGIKGLNYSLGTYLSLEEANIAYKKAFDLIESGNDISYLFKKKTNKTEYKGVYYVNGRFTAQIHNLGKNHNLGCYSTAKEASYYYELARNLKSQNKSIEHLIKVKKRPFKVAL